VTAPIYPIQNYTEESLKSFTIFTRKMFFSCCRTGKVKPRDQILKAEKRRLGNNYIFVFLLFVNTKEKQAEARKNEDLFEEESDSGRQSQLSGASEIRELAEASWTPMMVDIAPEK